MPRKPDSLIDADIHPRIDDKAVQQRLPEPWRTRWAAGSRGPGLPGYWNPNPINRPDAVTEDGQRIEADPHLLSKHHFDACGLEFGILNPGSSLGFGLIPDPDYAAAICTAVNDAFFEEWAGVDERFRLAITVAPNDPHRAAKEIRRLGSHPQAAQAYMASASPMPYGNRYYWPIYEAAAEMGLPVAIHPGTEGAGISGPATPAGYPSRYFEWHTVLVCNYIGQLVSLVTEGVFQQFPSMKFVMVEGGVSWIPPILWRFDKNWKALRATTPWLDRLPSEVIADHIRVTTQPIEEAPRREHLHEILAMFPAERMVMFSSDYPHWDGDTSEFAAKLLPEHLLPRIMAETARELYKLPVTAMRQA